MEIETSIPRDDVYPYVITRSNRYKYENKNKLNFNKFITKPLSYDEGDENFKEGKCIHMCHPDEARERDKNDFSEHFESRLGRKNEMDYELAIKKFVRPNYEDSSNRESMEYVRPIRTLVQTMDHLSDHVLDSRQNHRVIYDFYDDRTRAICGDITKQSCRHSICALSIHERIFRFYILFDYLLCEDPSTEQYLLNKHLSDRLRSCIDIYNICRQKKIFCPFEPEIQSYILLLSCDDTLEYSFRSAQLTDRVRESEEVKFVVSVIEAYRNDDFTKFFDLFKQASILHACIMNKLMNSARSKALRILTHGYKKNYLNLTLDYIMNFLLFSNKEDAMKFCRSRGVVFKTDSEVIFDSSLRDDDIIKKVQSNQLINRKVNEVKLSDIVDANCNNVYNDWYSQGYFTKPPDIKSSPKKHKPTEQKPIAPIKFEEIKVKPSPLNVDIRKTTPEKQKPFSSPQFKTMPFINRTPTQSSKPIFQPKFETTINSQVIKETEVLTEDKDKISIKKETKSNGIAVIQEPIKKDEIKPTVPPKPKRILDEESKNLITDLLYTLDIKSTLDPLIDKWRKYSKLQVKRRKKMKKIEELKSFLPPGRIMNTQFSSENKILQQYRPYKEEQKPLHSFESPINFRSILFGILTNKNKETTPLYWKMIVSTHQDIRFCENYDKEKWLLLNFFNEDLFKNTDPSPCVYYNVHNDEKSLYICHRYCTMEYLKDLCVENNRYDYSSILGSNSIIFILDKPDQSVYTSEDEYWDLQHERFMYILDIIANNTQIPILILCYLSYFDDISLIDINNTIYDRLNLEGYSSFNIKIGILKDIQMSLNLNIVESLSWIVEFSFKQPDIIYVSLSKLIEYHGCFLLNSLEEDFNSSVDLESEIDHLSIISTDTFIEKLKNKLSCIHDKFIKLYNDNTIKNWPAIEFTLKEYIHLINRDHILPRWNDMKSIKKIKKLLNNSELRNYPLSPYDISSINEYLDKIMKDYYMEYFVSLLRTQISFIFQLKNQFTNEEFIRWLGRCYMLLNTNILYYFISLIPKKLKIILPRTEKLDESIIEEIVMKYRNIEKYSVPFDLSKIYDLSLEDENDEPIEYESNLEEVILW